MIIQSKNVWYNEKFQPLQIEILDKKIKNIVPYGYKKADKDYGFLRILPGLIDIHNHGYMGRDANHATVEWVKEWSKYLTTEGVTSFLPTISTAPYDQLLEGLKTIAAVMDKNDYDGANILGIYSEGPFISEKAHGAQSIENRLIPTKEIIDDFQLAANNHIIYVMCAPEELGEDMEFIKYCVSNGISIAIGHTNATFEDCEKAQRSGAASFTHTFNAMSPLHHRNSGAVGAAMYFKDMYAELIADGNHVNKYSAKILADIKGKDRLISITDSSQFKGLPIGEHTILGRTIIVSEDGSCRLPNGNLAGSCNKLNRILQFEIEEAGIDIVTAIYSVTSNPAKLLGFDNLKGHIKINHDADLVVLNKDYSVHETYVMGKEMFG